MRSRGARGWLGASALFLALCGFGGGSAHAAMTPAAVAAAMAEAGAEAAVSEQDAGIVLGAADGYSFVVMGFVCDADAACSEYVFSAYFGVPFQLPLSRINDFNAAAIAGRAYIDGDGDANIEHMFSVGADDAAGVARNLAIWRELLIDFDTFLQNAEATQQGPDA